MVTVGARACIPRPVLTSRPHGSAGPYGAQPSPARTVRPGDERRARVT